MWKIIIFEEFQFCCIDLCFASRSDKLRTLVPLPLLVTLATQQWSIVFYRALVLFHPHIKINPLFIRQYADFNAKPMQRKMRTQKWTERTERWLMVLNLLLCYWSWIIKGCFCIIHEVVRPFSTPVLTLLTPHSPPWPSCAEELWGGDSGQTGF